MATVERRGFRGLADRANPAFAAAAVVVPLGALGYALFTGDLRTLLYVHVMAGVLWTGIDVFMGAVLGPVIGGLDPEEKASVFARFTPKMVFFMPVIATVTVTAGVELAKALGYWSFADPWILAALGIAAALTVVGFGIILPAEVRIYREIVSPAPDVEKIARLGMRNAKLGGVQGLLQLCIIYVMVNLRL